MALDLGDHLLQPPDSLLATLLGHLVGRVVLGLGRNLLAARLGFLGRLGRGRLVAEGVDASLSSALGGALGALMLVLVGGLLGVLSSLLDLLLAERLLLVVGGFSLRLEAIFGQIGGFMPGVVLGWAIDLRQLFFIGIDLVGSILSGVTSHITDEDGEVVQQFAELAVGDEKSTQGPQSLQRLVSMLLRGLFVGRSPWKLGVGTVEMLGLPDEVLEEIAVVLGKQKDFGLLNDVAKVGDEFLALVGQLVGRLGKGSRSKEAVQGDIDLFVLMWSATILGASWITHGWHFALRKSY